MCQVEEDLRLLAAQLPEVAVRGLLEDALLVVHRLTAPFVDLAIQPVTNARDLGEHGIEAELDGALDGPNGFAGRARLRGSRIAPQRLRREQALDVVVEPRYDACERLDD